MPFCSKYKCIWLEICGIHKKILHWLILLYFPLALCGQPVLRELPLNISNYRVLHRASIKSLCPFKHHYVVRHSTAIVKLCSIAVLISSKVRWLPSTAKHVLVNNSRWNSYLCCDITDIYLTIVSLFSAENQVHQGETINKGEATETLGSDAFVLQEQPNNAYVEPVNYS